MPTKIPAKKRPAAWRVVLVVVLLPAAAYLLGTKWHTVHKGIQIALRADAGWLAVSITLMVFTFFVAAAMYGVLALHRLRFVQTLLIELASACINRILPSGLGGLGLHGLYLYKRGHTGAEATTVVSVNNAVGMAAHTFLILLVVIVSPGTFSDLYGRNHFAKSWQIFAAVVVVALLITLVPRLRQRVASFSMSMLKSIRKLSLTQVSKALLLAMLMTITYTLVLLTVARSIGIELGVIQLFVIFSIGMFFGTATPTPGGLVGAEAGLYAGFVGFGVAAPDAAAAVILFRSVSYWLPLLPGAVAVLVARKRGLV
jgi:uncharacterized membrane protein YbhN (UPF0104 family)